MYNSLKKIYSLENNTKVYCGHEYTNNNLDFLISIFPKIKKIDSEKKVIKSQIKNTGSSIPFSLGVEKNLNPFLNPGSKLFFEYKKLYKLTNFGLFSYLRDLKNNF